MGRVLKYPAFCNVAASDAQQSHTRREKHHANIYTSVAKYCSKNLKAMTM